MVDVTSSKAYVARRLTERRIALRLSQDDLALRMAIKQSSVSVAECEGVATLSAIERYAEALDCSPMWLAYGTGKVER